MAQNLSSTAYGQPGHPPKIIQILNMSKAASSKGNEGKYDDDDDEDKSVDENDGPTLQKQFGAFIRYKNPNNPGTHILLSQSDFWMKHAGVIKGRALTTTDTGICYFKFKKHKLNYEEYLEFLQALADYKRIELSEIIYKMVNCGLPQDTAVPAL